MNGVPGTCLISNGLIYEAIVHPQMLLYADGI